MLVNTKIIKEILLRLSMNGPTFPIPYWLFTLLPVAWFLVRIILVAAEEKKGKKEYSKAIHKHLGLALHILSFNLVITTMFMPFVSQKTCEDMGVFVIFSLVAAIGNAATHSAEWYNPSLFIGLSCFLISIYLVLLAYGILPL